MIMKPPQPSLYRSNPDCKTTHVLFRISADDLDPDSFSKELRLTATHSFKKGDKFGTGQRARIRPWGVWQLSSEGKVRSKSPQRHAEYLLKRLEPKKEKIQKYLGSDKYFVDIYFWWQSAGSGGGFALTSSLTQRLCRLCDFMSYTFVQ